ncbi:insulinase family protein [Paroceanicella profunda]|uniref:Insulinase family protein n=1 Tax=Paroceanicella profunda TaxID=2579971 RepID=A0A5B8FIZ2_9RHOB|nr:pitrilysin family protein [Paroceanicella profunda]QDL93648.1 insulinase family protein [Paroceanicella profunda]
MLGLPAAAEAPVTHFTLDNGMEGVVIEDHRAPVVTHMVWYRIGSADEQPGKSGIAHFLEHLMFKGTDTIPEGAFSKIVAANGGQDNAFTSYDYTGYFQNIAADRLDVVMKMEADRMRNLVLSDAVVNPERDVILEERNSRVENNPSALFGEQMDAAQFMNHHYGIPVIGWRHEMEGLTREDALAFYHRYYAPNNAILVVAGDVDPAKVEEMAKEIYGPVAPTPDLAPRARPQEPPQRAPRHLTYEDPRVGQPYVMRTYLSPERNPGDQKTAAALTVLAELLGGSGLTSVMGQELQLKQKIALASGASYQGLSIDPNTFTVYVVPVPGVSLADAEAAMDKVIADFLQNGPDPDDLARIREQVRASEIYALDSQSGLARRYGSALAVGLTVEDVAAWPDLLQEVTADDVMAAAREVFNPLNSVTGWLKAPDPAPGAPEGVAPAAATDLPAATGEVTQ